MAERKKQSLLNGALVLSVAVVIVKLTGVLFKLYVTQKIGYTARGYFATAYNIYTPIYSIALAGLPTAVSKLVAEKAAQIPAPIHVRSAAKTIPAVSRTAA